MHQNNNTIKFYKYNGLGNDFIIINSAHTSWLPSSKWLIKNSNRKSGIGFDQALFIKPINDNVFNYKIANADGSWVLQCGNGARCAGALIANEYNQQPIYLQTANNTMLVEKITDSIYSVDMGKVTVTKTQTLSTPYGKFKAMFLDIGNPHLVIEHSSPIDANTIDNIGAWCQTNTLPEGVNVNFITKHQQNSINIQTFERGVGQTQSCASGACCSAVAFTIWYAKLGSINVAMAQGSLTVTYNQTTKSVNQQGPVEFNYIGYVSIT